MGRKWKRWYPSISTDTEIDLLSTAFGIPSRCDIERASQTSNTRRAAQYNFESDSGSDETCDCVLVPGSDDDSVGSSVNVNTTKYKNRVVDRPATPGPSSASRKRQHAQSRSSSLKSQRSTLSKKIKGTSRRKIQANDDKGQPLKSSLKSNKKASRSVPVSSYAPTEVEPHRVPAAYSPQFGPPQASSNAYFPREFLAYGTNPQIYHAMPEYAPQTPFPYGQHQTPTFVPPYAIPQVFHQQPNPPTTRKREINQESLHYQQVDNFQELQGLQTELDRLQREILVNPNDAQLRSDQQSTQNKLNDILNSIVAHKTHDTNQALNPPEKRLDDISKSSEMNRDKENEPPVKERNRTEAQPSAVSQEHRDSAVLVAQRRSKSPSCAIQHHLCSGCGGVRSQTFHKKHPMGAGHKPVLNFCSSCRVERHERGIMDSYHFCFGCGKVRSKAFQKKYKPKPGKPLLPNYCASCVVEVRAKEGMNEMSVVGRTLTESVQISEGASKGADHISSAATNSTSDGLPILSLQIGKASTNPSETRNIAKLRLEHTSHAKSISALVSPAESSPFYPGRKLGSAQRRAQRVSTPHSHEECQDNRTNKAVHGKYHEPYVEDVDSATEQTLPPIKDNNTGCFENQTSREEDVSQETQESYYGKFETMGQNISTLQTPNVAYTRTASLHSTTSSGEKTVQYYPRGHTWTQQSQSTISERSEHHLRGNTQPSTHEQFRFSKGVFGKNAGIQGRSVGETTRRTSPLADFEPSNLGTFDTRQGGGHELQSDSIEQSDPLPFRSSRGVFGRSCNSKKSQFSMFDYSWTENCRSGSKSPKLSEEQPALASRGRNKSEGNTRHPTQETPPNSFFSSDSGSRKEPTAFKSHLPNDGLYSRSVFTDYSRSTHNPYYNPRRRSFYNAYNSEYCSSWDPKSNLRTNNESSNTYGGAQFDDRVPEPIVEEPASPPSSPIPRTKLLEFNVTSESVPYELELKNDALSVIEFDVHSSVSSETSDSES